MRNITRMTAIVMAAALATSGPVLAADPPGSTPASPPRDPAPGMPDLLPNDNAGPTVGGIDRVPPNLPQPGNTPVPGLTADSLIDLDLIGATDFVYAPGSCYGLLFCCNDAWVQGCEWIEYTCWQWGGTLDSHMLSDGSTRYECSW